jgi:hypothetical protein
VRKRCSLPNERQARELAPLLDQPEVLEAVWRDVCEQGREERVTAAMVRKSVVKQMATAQPVEEAACVDPPAIADDRTVQRWHEMADEDLQRITELAPVVVRRHSLARERGKMAASEVGSLRREVSNALLWLERAAKRANREAGLGRPKGSAV